MRPRAPARERVCPRLRIPGLRRGGPPYAGRRAGAPPSRPSRTRPSPPGCALSCRAQATAAATSSTSRSPTVERPPDPPWPRNENVITAARWANTRAARRTAGRSAAPVNPCATTIAGVAAEAAAGVAARVPAASPPGAPKPAVHGSYTASTGTPSSVSNVANRGGGVSKGTEEPRNRPSDTGTHVGYSAAKRIRAMQLGRFCALRALLRRRFHKLSGPRGAGPHAIPA